MRSDGPGRPGNSTAAAAVGTASAEATSISADAQAYELFLEVFELPEDERDAALGQAAPSVAAQVRSLLGVEVVTDDGWIHPALGSTGMPAEEDPERIGPYRILEVLGEGGMGRVFLAEQREPVTRRVALKVLRLGFRSLEARARFEAERQAM
ncbi:MAG: hypothetical protein AAFX50_15915, partial [Acidobacteriota bacterium]